MKRLPSPPCKTQTISRKKPEMSENRGVHMIHTLETLSVYDEAELVRYSSVRVMVELEEQ
jgi:hypothetical protein